MAVDTDIVEHLKLIQTLIARHAASSFAIRGYSLTVVTLLYGYALAQGAPWASGIGLYATLVFAYLDAFYLRQERLVRLLYDDVRTGGVSDVYSMSVTKYLSERTARWPSVVVSRPLVGFFGSMVVVGVVVTVASAMR